MRPGTGGPTGVHELDRLFAPRSVAVVGASADPRKLSGRLHRHLLEYGFEGDVHLVNARHRSIAGTPAVPAIADVPGDVDLALVVVPAAGVLEVLQQCARKGVRFAAVLTSGFGEQDAAGAATERRMQQLVRSSAMRVLGPNAEGFANLVDGVAASFSPVAVTLPPPLSAHEPDAAPASPPSGVAVVSQSGGLGFALLDRGRSMGLAFTHVVTTGNEADVDATDVVDYLLHDRATAVVLVVCEGLRHPERLASLGATAEAAGKALVVAKLGRTPSGARAALVHTAHPVGSDEAYGAAFAAAGVHRAADDEALLDLAMLRSRVGPRPARRVAVVSVSGGGGVAAADALEAEGLEVPVLSDGLQERVRAFMPPFGSAANPVDLTAQALSTHGVADALAAVLESPEVDGVMVIVGMLNPLLLEREGEAIADAVARSGKPVVLYAYTGPSAACTELLAAHRLAWYPTATRAARALGALVRRTASAAHPPVAVPTGRLVEVLPGGRGARPRPPAEDVGRRAAAIADLRARGVALAGGEDGPGASTDLAVVVRATVDRDFGPLVTVGDATAMASALAPLDAPAARELLVVAGGACRRAAGSRAGDPLAHLVAAVASVATDWAAAPAPEPGPASELWVAPVHVQLATGLVEAGDVQVTTGGEAG